MEEFARGKLTQGEQISERWTLFNYLLWRVCNLYHRNPILRQFPFLYNCIQSRSAACAFHYSSDRLILLHDTFWVNHILGTLDGQVHYVHQAIPVLVWIMQLWNVCALYYTPRTGLPDYISSAGLYLCTRQLKYCTLYSSHIKHV